MSSQKRALSFALINAPAYPKLAVRCLCRHNSMEGDRYPPYDTRYEQCLITFALITSNVALLGYKLVRSTIVRRVPLHSSFLSPRKRCDFVTRIVLRDSDNSFALQGSHLVTSVSRTIRFVPSEKRRIRTRHKRRSFSRCAFRLLITAERNLS